MTVSRRTVFKSAIAGAATLPLTAVATAEPAASGSCPPVGGRRHAPRWAVGVEGQRKADLGDGTFLNPVIAGDHPDPTILKDGKDYYMTFSSFLSYPGLVIWHSRDLVNWRPLGAALKENIGSVFACDLIKHDGRYFIYIPAISDKGVVTYAIWADRIEGPWSDPVDLGIRGYIDPGHIVGEDGKRYLFLSGIRKVRLTDDGLAADGPIEDAYDPWRYPEDWIVENFAPEGPKLIRRDDYFYLITAVGGTAGPPTGHMVIAARSRSIHGPWEHCPHNPLVRTQSADEAWWSRGHASLVEGPAGDWWMVYHGYENGLRTLGRQTLLDPIEWTADGWFRAKGGDLSQPLRKPAGGEAVVPGMPLSDDFSRDRFGLQWSFHQASASNEAARASYQPGGLRIAAAGSSPADSAPLTCTVGDRAYEAEVSIELEDGAEGGLLLFYNHKAFVGTGFDGKAVKVFAQSEEQSWMRAPVTASRMRLKVTNDHDIATFRYSEDDGRTWKLIDLRMDVSGYNQNTFGGFLALKVGIYSSGKGAIRVSDFRYRALSPS
jgi:xylan 1,4-beta-xylosidase